MKAQTALTRTIDIKDRNGRVVGQKEVVTYQGLLSKAHDEGLKRVRTWLIQSPTKENGTVAIAKAEAETSKGVFQGYGDASPQNVNSFIVPHLIRMAETRAKARALRDATNVGVISFEELDGESLTSGDSDLGSGVPATAARSRPNGNGRPQANGQAQPTQTPSSDSAQAPMTEAQRRYLFRLLAGRGLQGESAHQRLLEELKVDSLTKVSKLAATQLIDRLAGVPTGGNGHGPRVQR